MTPVMRIRSRAARRWGSGIVLTLALILTGLTSGQAAAAGAPNLVAQLAPYQVLVFSKTVGFRHDSIPAGITAIQQLGAANGFTVTATEDATAFTTANLANYATVVFLSTTADVLNAAQQTAFEGYIRGGGGYVGVHAAADTEYDWAWYGGLVGAYFNQHPAIQQATVKVEDPAHPSTAALPALWPRTEEWYNYRTNPRGTVHVLESVDEKTYAPGAGAMGADHPITWCQDYDGGRSWYTGLGHDIATYSDSAFRGMLLGGIQTTAGAVAADCGVEKAAGFQKVSLDSNTQNPMELDIAPDGRVFYIERDGRIQIIKPTTGTTVTAIDLDVFNGNEDGLLGIVLDPNFATNNWVYVYYSPPTGAIRNQISRFTVAGDTIALNTEKVLLQIPTQRNTCCHMGGSMVFDGAGNLYLAVGDNTNPFEADGFDPIDERAGRQDYDSQRTAGNTNDLRGKIVRIKPQTDGTYTVPAGNLFPPGTALTRPEIYAMGFRNPFRIGVDLKTNTLYVADYGPDAQSANPSRGPEGTVEWNVVTPGNYGWPYCIGNNYSFVDYTFPSGPSGAPFNCGAIVNNSSNNTGLQNLPPAKPATVDYDYGGNSLFPEIGGGGAPMGGPVYRYNAALVSDREWPAYYDGKAMFGEWNQNKLYTFQVGADGKSLVDINSLLPSMSFKRPMDFDFGPDGALYMIEWGSGFGGDNDDSGIYRIDYISGGRAPIAVAAGTPTSGPVPLSVQFSSAGSRDPDGQAITYAWTFGDGGTSTAANPSHTYATAGSYTAQLTVKDPDNRTAVANVLITVGNTAPTVTITTPPAGGFFAWGDTVHYTVTVTDPEDGAIDCNRVTVNYSLGHDEHAHTLATNTGCSGSFVTTSDTGHGADANIFGVLEAVYTDNGGAGGTGAQTGRSIIVLQPKHKQAEYYTATGRAPDGIGGGDPGVQKETTSDPAGGLQNLGFIEDGDYWTMAPANLTNIMSIGFRVASASTGGRIEVRNGAANGPVVATATVPVTGGWQTFVDVTATISGQSGGSGPLYFVAKNPLGNTGQGSIFNVNWMDFNGRGVADSGSQLAVNPGSLAFGSVAVGATSAAQTVTVTNPAATATTISSITVAGQYTQTNNCPASLPAGGNCTVTVRFAPTSAGGQAGTLAIANSSTSLPVSVSLSGTGTSGSTNLALTATMSASSSNTGFPPSNVNDNNADTYWESAGALPAWLQADLHSSQPVGSVTLKVPPAASWSTRTQTLSVTGSNDGTNWTVLSASAGRVFNPASGNQVTIPLPTSNVRYLRLNISANTGWPAGQISEFGIYSTGGTGGGATLTPSSSTVAFGNQPQNSTSPARPVTITNSGSSAAALSSIAVTAQFGQINSCGTSLAAGASCTVNVTFTPTALGAVTGNLTVTSNATNPTLTVGLTGTGTAPGSATLSASPTSVAFGNQAQGSTSTARTITITNAGTSSASISSTAVTGVFARTTTCGATLAAGASCTVSVTFSPTAVGAASGTLTVASNATNPSLTVPLTGTGTTATATNLALNKPVTANASGSYAAANAVDADANSYWESPNNAFPQSITIDLGSAAALSSIVLRVPAAWGARTQTLSVLGSTDGSAYSTIVGSTGYAFPAGGAATITVPASTSARYVRLTFTQNTAWPAAQLSDLQIMGTAGTGGGADLALNRPITASSFIQTYAAAQAVDADPSSYWESAGSFPQALTVDLGSAQQIRSVTLRLPPASSWGARNQTLSILGSADGSTFGTVVGSAQYGWNPATGNSVTVTFTATTTRYVRLSFTANSGSAGAQLSAFSVFA